MMAVDTKKKNKKKLHQVSSTNKINGKQTKKKYIGSIFFFTLNTDYLIMLHCIGFYGSLHYKFYF